MNSTVLNLQDISIRYPGRESFKPISLQINKAEHIALVGENSSLITGVLDAIAGRAIVAKGRIDFDFMESLKVDDAEVSSSPYHYIAYVSSAHQFRSLNGVHSAYYQQRYNSQDSANSETVEDYLRKVHSTTGNRYWNFENVLRKLHLTNLLEEHLIKLSNGETKRVRLAAAMLENPAILLLDHPFTGIDRHLRLEISLLIDEISQSGTTIIMATAANEIPASITGVVLFEPEKSIQSFSKEAFHQHQLPSFQKPEEGLLRELLSEKPTVKYNTIVGMKGVSIRYGEQTILNNIYWTIRQGERWSLSGPNGSGKTTLLSLINGDNP